MLQYPNIPSFLVTQVYEQAGPFFQIIHQDFKSTLPAILSRHFGTDTRACVRASSPGFEANDRAVCGCDFAPYHVGDRVIIFVNYLWESV